MPSIAAVGTHLPFWACDVHRIVGDHGDGITPFEKAERAALVDSLEAATLDAPVVVGVDHMRAGDLCVGGTEELPTSGASAGLFASSYPAEAGTTGRPVAVEQAVLPGAHADIAIPPVACEHAFEAKNRWEAGKSADSGLLDMAQRHRVTDDGGPATDYALVTLPRGGAACTAISVQLPTPELGGPNAAAILESDDVHVRIQAKVTGAESVSVGTEIATIPVLRRVAMRSGVPDYGYAFKPESEMGAA
jgi:hypothetical protein